MIHELRIYHAVPGRLPDLNKRFETITLKLWEKHGIRQAGFWTVLIGPNNHQLYYLVEWKDMRGIDQSIEACSDLFLVEQPIGKIEIQSPRLRADRTARHAGRHHG